MSFSLDASSLRQAQLPTSKGGTGLRSAVQHAAACYIASASAVNAISDWNIEIPDSAYDLYNSLVSAPLTEDDDDPIPQKELSARIDDHSLDLLLESASEASKARLRSVLGPHATAWLTVVPSSRLSTKFKSSQYQTAMKLFLGQPVYPKDKTCCCNSPLDKLGVHSLICKKKGDIIRRHNAIRDCIFVFCKEAGLSVVKEKAGLLGDKGDKRRPADVFIDNFSQNSDYCLDVAVTSPLQKKYIKKAAEVDNHAGSDYFLFKMSKYSKAVEEANLTFSPIIFEAFGRIAPESIAILTKIACIRADRLDISRSESISTFYQRLSVSLQIRNANMVLKRDPVTN
jgi:hypothetical protein